jgi:hypothetical protein
MPEPSGAIDLLKNQRYVAPDFNQSCLLLQFAEPIARAHAGEFLRIHLTRDMLIRGEDAPFLPEVFQPQRMGEQLCTRCQQPMARLSLFYTKCTNRGCDAYGMRHQNGPVQGVVDVLVFDEFVMEPATETQPARIDRCLLVLDRRYDDAVLARVYRTCGVLCEFYGWKLANAPAAPVTIAGP